MKDIARTVGMLLAIFLSMAAVVKIYESIAETYVPNYGERLHQHSGDLHVGLIALAVGVTAIWRLRR